MAARTDIGPPNYKTMLPPVIERNYGNWLYHEILKPGVLMHVSGSGEALYSVRAGSPRLVSTDHIREICEIADKYCNGYLRFNQPAQHRVSARRSGPGRPADRGAERPRLSRGRHGSFHFQHCSYTGLGALPHAGDRRFRSGQGPDGRDLRTLCGSQAAGARPDRAGLLPEHVRRSALLGHRHSGHSPNVPKTDNTRVPNVCEIPSTVASCPTGAIRGDMKNKTLTVNEEKCMYCGNCYTVCPAMPIADPDNDGISIWVGGRCPTPAARPNSPSWRFLSCPTIRRAGRKVWTR